MARSYGDNLFERLLLLPLFQGIGRSEFLEIAGRIRMGFQRVPRGTVIAEQDAPCDALYFVLGGEIEARKISDNRHYTLLEWFTQPTVIQLDSLFGMRTRYSRTYTATTTLQLLQVDKAAVRDILFYYPTFRINYLNMLSTQVQQAHQALGKAYPQALQARFVAFLQERCLRPAGKKELRIKMEDLAEELLVSRLKASTLLNEMSQKQMLELHRGRIVVPMLEHLIQTYR